jgi:hypothetical protein
MHFEGVAARWLQFVDRRLRTASWSEICSWIHDHFGRDQHESLIRQLFHIKQITSVQDYIDRFTELVDQLVAYEHSFGHRYYTTRFVDGLKDEIKSVILVQWHVDLDTACSLALLHQEAETSRRREYGKPDFLFKAKSSSVTTPLPLPPPPQKQHKEVRPYVSQSADASATNTDSKMAALRAYQMARGLCKFCAEKKY